MTKEKHPLLAVAAASLAVALAACDQTTPAAGGPGPGAALGAPPAAAEPGLRTETLIVAIVADEDDDARLAQRVAATQTNVTAAATLHFPSDFGTPVRHNSSALVEYDWDHHLPVAGITQTVIDRGGIIPWASIDGGASWHAGGFALGGAVKLRFVYRAGDAEDEEASGSVTITLAASAYAIGVNGASLANATRNVQHYLTSNSLLIRFFIITDQE